MAVPRGPGRRAPGRSTCPTAPGTARTTTAGVLRLGLAASPPRRLAASPPRRLAASWTLVLGSALAALIPGIMVPAWPGGTLHMLAVLVGLSPPVAGAPRFVAAFPLEERDERVPRLLVAVLLVLAGVLCLRHPLQTIAALSLIVGVVWLVTGMLTAYTAFSDRDLPHRAFVLGTAALGIVAGFVVLALPIESAVVLARLLGLWLVLLGLAELVVAFARSAALRRACAGRRSGGSTAA
ncbi:HdeD family acid-resistance protein [Streptomyces sp. NPDC057062]|uniref:HdeD family acid-resistance protein n=1 Tax=Streptomyces sp. NPDC057062 TaxID=3346011 RepID=UPI00362C208A